MQWTFEAVPSSEHFPCGVRATYRKYSADEVIQIIANAESPGGFDVFDLEIANYPVGSGECPPGMHILMLLPEDDQEFEPEPFVSGSRQTLIDVVKAVEKNGEEHNQKL